MLRQTLILALLGLSLGACHDAPAPAEATTAAATASAPPSSAGQHPEEVPAVPAAEANDDEHEATAADGPPEEPHPYDENANARAEIDAAVAASARDGKPTLLVFGANWCPWCRRLDYLMKHDAPIMAALDAGYHLVHVNIGDRHSGTNANINEAYGNPMQHGLPVMVVLNGEGEVEHTQETGTLEEGDHHDPAKVLAFLEQHRARAVH